MLSSQRVARLGNWRGAALLGLLSLASAAVNAQNLNYTASNSYNLAGTYTDLGTSGTVITTANADDANSTAQNIGFQFAYNGQNFTQFVLNTNGFLKLGSTAPSRANFFAAQTDPSSGGPFNSPDANDTNLLLPFNFDLEAGTAGAEYRVVTTGTAPDRVCTIQWKNVSDKVAGTTAGKQYDNFSFQVKLYETTNFIEFVYGSATAGAASTGPDAPKFASVGLKGSGTATNQVITTTKPSINDWSTTTFRNTNYAAGTNGHNFRRTVLPDPGRTFRFALPQANDAAVVTIYTQSKLPRTIGTPHTIRAVVRNAGTAAMTLVPVTLTISGANTFTSTKIIPSLATTDTLVVTFDPFTPANLGNETVSVSLLSDANNANNTKTYAQEVTPNVYRYDNNISSGFVNGIPVAGNPQGAYVTRYNTAAARTVTSVNVRLGSATASSTVSASAGRTVYAVVLSSNGTIIGRTPDYVITAADVAATTLKSFTFATPVPVPAGDFFAGLVSVNPTGSLIFYPIVTQEEIPTRPLTFFTIRPFTGSGQQTLLDVSSIDLGIPIMEVEVNNPTGVSKALQNSVSVYPNPSNGQVTLEVRGANAQHGLRVEVSNLLGQRVYTGTAKDNFNNSLNLAHLPKGLYTVKVSDGDQYMMRTLTISK